MTEATVIAAPDEARTFYFSADDDIANRVTITVDDALDGKLTAFGKATLSDRYLIPGERFQDLFARVAIANSDDYLWGENAGHAQRVYEYIAKGWFMPATPVLSNSGTDRGQPISCFLNLIEDNLASINEGLQVENFWLSARGGGIGTCWSPVRSIGEPVGLSGKTSGIIPFIHIQDALSAGISQGSLRRGSAAVYLDASHPEIMEFLDIRRADKGSDHYRKAENLHHGVTVPNAFMQAVKDDTDWDLISPHTGVVKETVRARDIWQKILITRLETGEPYIVFIDTMNKESGPTYQKLGLKIRQSNLCSEIALTTGMDHLAKPRTAVCCLSSLNMATSEEWFGNDLFIEDVLRFLDNVMTNFIEKTDGVDGFERARYSAIRERSVGLGFMGLHTFLQSKMIPFESFQAVNMQANMWRWIRETADKANIELSVERGACPDAIDAGLEMRFSHMFSIAPTASISIICGGVSAAGEPIPANVYTHKTLSGSFEVRNPHLDALLRARFSDLRTMLSGLNADMTDWMTKMPAWREVDQGLEHWLNFQWKSITANGGSVQHLPFLTDWEKGVFRTFVEIDQRWVIEHAAARGPYIDQAQSTNIALPADVHKKDLHTLHMLAWEKGLKSLYYLRSLSIQRAQVVGHMAGEMPQPDQHVASTPLFDEALECLACQ